MTTLAQMENLGCYVSAGWIDHYDGVKHTRLGMLTTGGDVVFENGGEAYADALSMKAVMAALGTEAVEIEVAPVSASGGVTTADPADQVSLRSWDGVPIESAAEADPLAGVDLTL